MPVVTLLAPEHPDMPSLLTAVADAVAAALDLGRGEVIAVHAPAGQSALSGDGPVAECWWPVVTLHGRDRGPDASDASQDAAAEAVRGWAHGSGVALDGVWATWLHRR